MVFQSLKALVGSTTFHGVMTGCLKCQGDHITGREKQQWGGRECDRKRPWYMLVKSPLAGYVTLCLKMCMKKGMS